MADRDAEVIDLFPPPPPEEPPPEEPTPVGGMRLEPPPEEPANDTAPFLARAA